MSKIDSPHSTPNIRLALLPLLSITGAGAAVYLSKHYYDLRTGTAGFKSLCNIGEAMNCDAVTSSRFAEIVPGLPLSSFVAGWFIALFILGLMARVPDWRREAVLVSTLMSGFASLYSIALLAVMFLVLHRFCLFCMLIDAASFGIFAVCLSLMLRSRSDSIFGGASGSKLRSNALIVAGVMLVTVVILRPTAENGQQTATETQYAINQVLERAPVPVTTPPGAAILGNPNAPITIHEFSDFQCPFCKRGAVLMNQLIARYPGKVRVVFMPFPLDNACNRMVTRAMHPFACELARAAYCSGKEGKFQPTYEKIFEDQEFLTAQSATKIPAEFGVGADLLKACLASEDAKKHVAASIDEGVRLGVAATPTFFINGRKVDTMLPIEAWDQLIAGAK